MADKKRLQGIALILFGILLCLAEEEINRELFHSIGYFPFALIGAITGIAGLGLNQKKFDQLMASFGNIQYLENTLKRL